MSKRQYCVVVDPVGDDNKNRLGLRQLRKGPCTFFLHPGQLCVSLTQYTHVHHFVLTGERLESGIQDSMVLEADECLVVTAQDAFMDTLPDGMDVQRKCINFFRNFIMKVST